MARPEEKANAMMNKWVAMRDAGNAPRGAKREKRPHLASECTSLDDAQRFRRQLLREITDLIAKIQNPGLGEHVIRDTNDDINKKMREKHHWNKRIKELGGPDFYRQELKQQLENANSDENAILGSGGYRYYGAAKDLPGVRELFERQQLLKQKKRYRGDLYKRITPDYYGWREEEDGVLEELEQKACKGLTDKRDEQDRELKRQRLENGQELCIDDDDYYDDDVVEPPSQELMASALLERKKQQLLARFA
jgi:pre-mRNA-splicing factor ISY1